MGLIPEPGPADVVRRQYLASAAGDLDALRATLAPDVEWTEMAGFPLAGTYRTPEGVTANVMEKLAAEWDDWTAHDDTYVVEGENVVVLARYTARHRTTSKALAVRVAHHFIVRGGLIVRFEQFVDTALVRDAASSTSPAMPAMRMSRASSNARSDRWRPEPACWIAAIRAGLRAWSTAQPSSGAARSRAAPRTMLSHIVITSRSCPSGTPAALKVSASSSYMPMTSGDDTV